MKGISTFLLLNVHNPLHQHCPCFQTHGWGYVKFIACSAS